MLFLIKKIMHYTIKIHNFIKFTIKMIFQNNNQLGNFPHIFKNQEK